MEAQIPPDLTVTFTTVDGRGATGLATAPLTGPVPQHLQIRPGALSLGGAAELIARGDAA